MRGTRKKVCQPVSCLNSSSNCKRKFFDVETIYIRGSVHSIHVCVSSAVVHGRSPMCDDASSHRHTRQRVIKCCTSVNARRDLWSKKWKHAAGYPHSMHRFEVSWNTSLCAMRRSAVQNGESMRSCDAQRALAPALQSSMPRETEPWANREDDRFQMNTILSQASWCGQ